MIKKTIKKFEVLLICTILGFLAGCATNDLNTPCPNYGASCHKTFVNSAS